MRGKTDTFTCEVCKEPFTARVADRKRGWARCCSKRCACIRSNAKTGKYARYLAGRERDEDEWDDTHPFADDAFNNT